MRHTLHGLQLWLAIPEADEEIEPAFYHYPAGDLPTVEIEGVSMRVMMGTAYGIASPVKTFAETLYVEAHLQPGQRITLPDAEERAVYVASGSLTACDTGIPEHSMALFSAQSGVVLEATSGARIGSIGGENIGPRHIEWNFVSSRKERIEQARADWKAQRFAKIPGDEEEFIPLPR